MIETNTKNQNVAVIDIGTSAIRMSIAEVTPKMEIHYLENVQKPIALGKDVFSTGRISRASMREAITILLNFKSVLATYGITKVQAIATSAVREAVNRDNFTDRVYIRTGVDVEVIDGPEGNRLSLISMEYALNDKVNFADNNCLIVEVGSGSTEIILFNHGHVEYTRTIPMGSIRLPEQIVSGKSDVSTMKRILKRNIREIIRSIANESKLEQIDTIVAMGADMRFVARQICEDIKDRHVTLEGDTFLKFVEKILRVSPEEIVSQYGVFYSDAETMAASLLIYANFLKSTSATKVIIPLVSIRDGLLLELAQMLSPYKRTDVSRQVVNSAKHLGEKYQFDRPHALYVASVSVKLFDQLNSEHGLGPKERLLLEVAALLHDIGVYISPIAHHKHSFYLIEAEEIFGLRKIDKTIVANVVRYHRRSVPKSTHVPYMSLPKAQRAAISKLAAILRVADSLDKARQQRLKSFTLERNDDIHTIWVSPDIMDISLERDTLAKKGELYADVFGAPIVLKKGTVKP